MSPIRTSRIRIEATDPVHGYISHPFYPFMLQEVLVTSRLGHLAFGIAFLAPALDGLPLIGSGIPLGDAGFRYQSLTTQQKVPPL